jgi:hypothetical protein
MLGMLVGVLLAGAFFAQLESFYESTPRGSLTLPSLFNAPYGVIVLFVVGLALAGFHAAEVIESRRAK